ncbi:MAG: ATP-binding protein [Candidatus Binataceae bacterium]
MKAKRPLTMRISLNALEHLGMNLYSNVPAVLSEIVANSWDADAENVNVTIDKVNETITIDDDGIGMDRDDVIDHFLTVGFKRRATIGDLTPIKQRKPMGRKGIGKLSSFSIARVVDVFTIKDKQRTAFRMDRDVIKACISSNDSAPYEPPELSAWPKALKVGTRIVLSGLSKRLSEMTVAGLKRRVARRFAIIGPKFDFRVLVEGEEISPADRGYQNALEYLWVYGDQAETIALSKSLARKAENRTSVLKAAAQKAGIQVSGWIGTVAQPRQLHDEEGDNLNRIAIFMRGKMAQEDILDEFGQKEIYADYVIGELHCDDLDNDSLDDIATSSRQSIKVDDPRYQAVRDLILGELRYIASRWSDWRREDGAKQAANVPEVSSWLEALEGSTKKKAERWVGRLNVIRSETDTDKKELLKASILAFESYRRKEQLEKLEEISDESLTEILSIFREIDDLELSYYGQIVKLRVGVIKALQDKLSQNDKEAVLRDYIFDHLWLLDTSWERARGSEHVETTVNNFLKDNTKSLPKTEKRDRIDIGYRASSGKHVIIELKRASVAVPLDTLTKQIRKYRDGARKILDKSAYKGWPLEIVCLLGKPPPEYETATGPAGVQKSLAAVDARIMFYDELLNNAQQAYADYLEAHVKIDKLWSVFQAIDDFAPPTA